jgi:hypothetical protein
VPLNCNRDIRIKKKKYWLNSKRKYAPYSVAVLDKTPCNRVQEDEAPINVQLNPE